MHHEIVTFSNATPPLRRMGCAAAYSDNFRKTVIEQTYFRLLLAGSPCRPAKMPHRDARKPSFVALRQQVHDGSGLLARPIADGARRSSC
ncbi:MAG: hypothetical protein P4L82_01175 [Ancalomicrobiaceae bacterium]|nr:hypothetical protein [Ancalomicrobiaceae bacterium]